MSPRLPIGVATKTNEPAFLNTDLVFEPLLM
jgi:hypothetical protein